MILAALRWDESVRTRLDGLIAADHGPAPLAVFDWDETCIAGDIGEGVLTWLDAQDGGGRMHEYERLLAEQGKPVAYPWCAFEPLRGRTPAEVRDLADRVIDDYLRSGRIRERPEIKDLIAAMRAHHWDVYVVSASAEPLVRAFGERYGFPADHVIGMRVALEAGRYVPRLDGPSTFRQGKVDAINQFIGRQPTFVAGDTETDIEMMLYARNALLIDRQDPRMMEYAVARGWATQRFA